MNGEAGGCDGERGRKTDLWMVNDRPRTVWRLSGFIASYFLVALVLGIGYQFLPGEFHTVFVQTLLLHMATAAATVIAVYAIDQRTWKSVGLWFFPCWSRAFLGGTGFGIALILLAWIPGVAAGWEVLPPASWEAGYILDVVGSGAVLYLLVGIGEELLFRGYCFQALIEGTSEVVAVVSTAVVFGLAHAFNPHADVFSMINIGLAGMMFGIAYIRTRSLWLTAGIHFGWNFAQGTLLGMPVSGMQVRGLLNTRITGPDWLTGDVFGLEGGLGITVVLLLAILALYHPAVARLRPEESEACDHENERS